MSNESDEDKCKSLKKVLKAYYKENFQLKSNDNGKLVMNVDTGGQVTCTYCGKKGHTDKQYWKKQPQLRPKKGGKLNSYRNNNGGGKKNGPCWICSGPHQKKQCPQYKGNNNNDNDDSVNGIFMGFTLISGDLCKECENEDQVDGFVVMDKEEEETFVGNIDEGKTMSLLRYMKEMERLLSVKCCLGDSGSMAHTICNEDIELDNEVKTDDKIHGFDRSAVNIKAKGDLIVKDISTGCEVKLANVRKSKCIKKNIISIGQLQNEGWILRGNESILILEKVDSSFYVSSRVKRKIHGCYCGIERKNGDK